MNHNRKVITFIIVVTSIHLILSLFSNSFIGYFPSFKNVNLISDIVVKQVDKNDFKKEEMRLVKHVSQSGSAIRDFDAYLKKGTLISFNQDTINPALKKFTDKLIALSANKKVKIRIAWFGDSQIEGDFITQDLRELLQNYFGQQKGVGYVPISSVSADFRHSAQLLTVGDITSDNFKKQQTNSNLFLSGYSFFSNDLSIDFKDNVKRKNNQITQKWLLYGKGDSISVKINDSIRKYPADKDFNRILVGSGVSNKAKFQVSSNKTPLYGMSSEPESGIILDNFSFRGITGVELKKVDSKMLQEINNSGYYDLIVFQYGVNLMFKPDDTNYDYYYRAMKNVLKKFKTNMPDTEFLMLSCSDRAFNYDGQWKTAVGIDSLINTQAKLAYNNKLAFYNFYQSIGGNGTIVKWADSTVKLANKDYVHFNFRGANAVAKIIYKALINDYNKAVKIKNNPSQTKQISNTIVKKEIAI
jgi:lysophospholipase L1-like esterase